MFMFMVGSLHLSPGLVVPYGSKRILHIIGKELVRSHHRRLHRLALIFFCSTFGITGCNL